MDDTREVDLFAVIGRQAVTIDLIREQLQEAQQRIRELTDALERATRPEEVAR